MVHGLLKCPRCKWRGNLNTNTCPKCGHLLRQSIQSGKKDRSAGIRSQMNAKEACGISVRYCYESIWLDGRTFDSCCNGGDFMFDSLSPK